MKKYIDHILNKSKETKGTVVYRLQADTGDFTVYVPKEYLKGDKPDRVKITIESTD